MKTVRLTVLAALCVIIYGQSTFGQNQYSGIYPHLAYFNHEGECGTGAVVPWANRLWVITYAPHKPKGSSDKLYEITSDLELIIRPESVGGTPANRMIHKESEQLFIGPYIIDKKRKVRVIPPSKMFGRLTGNARHLTDPKNKIYYATMEEGFYEVDVKTLEVNTLFYDEQLKGETPKANLPGYHGKGLYSGQGRLIYANNGENSKTARKDPFVPSGVLSEWDGKSDTWSTILRNQFTEVTGPGGIYGNSNPESDPVWSVGWDAKSVILYTLHDGNWHRYRLPKSSHSYDGAHGWNTEWPRIRDIGEKDLLMTMHGMFWSFPKNFTPDNTSGIMPRSSYLKVIGDFCRWQDKVVLGCDDSANKEFLNKRKAKGHIEGPQSQSNLWFVEPDTLDHIGHPIGRGAIWLNDAVTANTPSDPFLISGFDSRGIHLASDKKTVMTLEVDKKGNGQWTPLTSVDLDGYQWQDLSSAKDAVWLRLTSSVDLESASASFSMSTAYKENSTNKKKFNGVSQTGDMTAIGGLIRATDDKTGELEMSLLSPGKNPAYYRLDGKMNLVAGKLGAQKPLEQRASIPSLKGILHTDDASTLYIDDKGRRYRLPKNDHYLTDGPLGTSRLCREVATERDLFNSHGTFFELPAENAGGFSRVRPVSSHNFQIKDFCSFRGLFVISGINPKAPEDNAHIIRSKDGKAALWVGAIDDIWSLGKPTGKGGPWQHTDVKAGTVSDPYLMTGYDTKALTLASTADTVITAEVDISGMGDWQSYKSFIVTADKPLDYVFPEAFHAYWIRFSANSDTTATAQLDYK